MEDRNIHIEYRWSGGNAERMQKKVIRGGRLNGHLKRAAPQSAWGPPMGPRDRS
jgi:hypothetical protein